ncbi:MAG: Ig-like domain-containing protein [Prevotella sp.]|nr:Ig-like domain-containing protein [Prevotella sp.]
MGKRRKCAIWKHHGRVGRLFLFLAVCLASCARMGQPDGGWYDEQPPKIVSTSPADQSVNFNGKRVIINFDEYIKIDNATEKVVVSPPQLELPEIKGQGKRIVVDLKDSLKANTTYTIDFSDAISDNNENNPLGNYTFTFSTGDVIDTMEVSGHVLNAENLEPIKGILVGLYTVDDATDTTAQNGRFAQFAEQPMLRVSRTDSRGRFVVKGVAPGNYRIYALQDVDGDYKFSQKSEILAFQDRIITPSSKPDIRQDTIWADSLHIKSITQVGYTHFLPDDIVLLAFNEVLTDRFFLKSERKEPECFTLFFSGGDEQLPVIRRLNFDEHDAFLTETSERNDTVTYWLRDTTLVNQDTLRMEVQYMMTDSTGVLVSQTDTLEVLSRISYEKRLKDREKAFEQWKKEQEKRQKRGEKFETEMSPEPMKVTYRVPSNMAPDQNLLFEFATPLQQFDSTAVHLYSKHDSLWYRVPFELEQRNLRTIELRAAWRPNRQYSLEIDSTAFVDIYGKVSKSYKQGLMVPSEDTYGSLFVPMSGMEGKTVVVQLLTSADKAEKTVTTTTGTAEFYYIKPGDYYLRAYVDENGNGRWDTGEFDTATQPEPVYYYPGKITCRAKWDVTQNWNPTARNRAEQKPLEITKQKPEKEKKIKYQNAERARKLGITYEQP